MPRRILTGVRPWTDAFLLWGTVVYPRPRGRRTSGLFSKMSRPLSEQKEQEGGGVGGKAANSYLSPLMPFFAPRGACVPTRGGRARWPRGRSRAPPWSPAFPRSSGSPPGPRRGRRPHAPAPPTGQPFLAVGFTGSPSLLCLRQPGPARPVPAAADGPLQEDGSHGGAAQTTKTKWGGGAPVAGTDRSAGGGGGLGGSPPVAPSTARDQHRRPAEGRRERSIPDRTSLANSHTTLKRTHSPTNSHGPGTPSPHQSDGTRRKAVRPQSCKAVH